MGAKIKKITPKKDELLFLPLGGCNEIGMNLNLYGHDGQWLMVDCGISFGNNRMAGIDVIMPNPQFIAHHKKQLQGLVLTHAHEDHVGGVPYLWHYFECPIYATPFTMQVLRHKLTEAKMLDRVLLHEIDMSDSFSVGNFDIELITLTHSIPEPNALVIRTKAGNILHSGDWKFDDDPVVGDITDEAALKRAGDEGILAMLCDSTNVFVEGESESEGVIAENLKSLLGTLSGRVFITCFASNVARLQSLFSAAEANSRHVVLAGNAMHRMVKYAQETGYLSQTLDYSDAEYAEELGDNIVILCTGSQGEPLAALPRMARGEHPKLKFKAGDFVVFSSRVIPGNELSISHLQNQLVRLGVHVIGDSDYGDALHASGHPHQDELVKMYQLIKPHLAIPVHGEARHLQAHAELAEACQVPHQYVARNGDLLRLSKNGVEKITDIEADELCYDGYELAPMTSPHLSERRKLGSEGVIFCSLVCRNGKLLDVGITIKGVAPQILPDGKTSDEVAHLQEVASKTYGKLTKKNSKNTDIAEAVRIALRRISRKHYGKNAIVSVHFSDL